MASDIIKESISPGSELIVEVDKMYENIFTVINKKNTMKGILIPVSNKNNAIFEQLITECKELSKNYDNEKIAHSSFCVPDSTLSHNTFECNSNISDSICVNCKQPLQKVPKSIKRPSINRELKLLTHHGFNENLLKKKNDQRRRVSSIEILQKVTKIKVEKKEMATINVNTNEVNPNFSRPKRLDKFNNKRNILLATRCRSERALKTRANEKIIDLCSKKKSLKPTAEVSPVAIEAPFSPPVSFAIVAELPKPKPKTALLSDASIYDFIDEDCESETLKPKKKIDRKIMLKKVIRRRTVSEIVSPPNPPVEPNSGSKFSVNDIVWAKIPGYPYWPAHIHQFDNGNRSNWSSSGGGRCLINWIGWNQKSYLPLKSLLHFKENFASKYSSKLKSIKYKTAIDLACSELHIDLQSLITVEPLATTDSSNDDNGGSAGSKRKSTVNLDEIFVCGSSSSGVVCQRGDVASPSNDDDDTDEEEKARSALVTMESVEADSKLSSLISKV